MKKIIVIGSSNVDMVMKTSHLPAPGETILGGEFLMNQGGKGANQAVAVRRMGGNLIFMAKLGNDILGRQSLEYFENEGIDTRYLTLTENAASGVALISVDSQAENSIIVASGANMLLNEQDVDRITEEMEEGDILLMQLEIPLQTVVYAAKKAFEKGVKMVLNPAPACNLPQELFPYLYMITPNAIEAEMLAGIPQAVLVYVGRDVVSFCLERVARISHRNGQPALSEHAQVVHAVAEHDNILVRDMYACIFNREVYFFKFFP